MKNEEKHYFDTAIEYENLYKALKKCCRNIRWKDSVVGYEGNALRNTMRLREDLVNGTYKISPYQVFTIHEPKERTIVATRIRDRQFQKSLCDNGLYDDIVEHLIYDDGACLTGKGTDFTLDRLTTHLRRYFHEHGTEGWVLKCDIRKFFPSTNHEVAKAAVRKRVSDPKACEAVCTVIDSFGGDKGIGLGSQISQLVELSVLDDLDHYIKEKLRIKHYIRYMDDFVLIHESKSYLKWCRIEIAARLSKLGLTLNEKTTIYPLKQGVKLMKWRFILTPTGKILRRMDGAKFGKQRRKMKKLMRMERAGTLPPGTTRQSFICWRANAKRGDTYFQRQQMEHFYYTLKGDKRYGNDQS